MSNKRTAAQAGFIQDLSPLKKADSGCSYYNFQLQNSESESVRVVAFNTKAYTQMDDFQTAKSPIKLDNTIVREGKDIVFNAQSSVKVLDPLDLNFEFSEIKTTPRKNDLGKQSKLVTIAMVKDLDMNDLVQVKGTVSVGSSAPKLVNDYNGSKLKLKEDCCIEDLSGAIKLQLWQQFIGKIEDGKTYDFNNLAVRIFKGTASLASTRSTTFKEEAQDVEVVRGLDALLVPDVSVDIADFEKMRNISIYRKCSHCSNKVVVTNTKTTFVKCTYCGVKSKISKLPKELNVEVEISDEKWLTVFTPEVKKLLEMSACGVTIDDQTDEIEDTILSVEHVRVTYDDVKKVITSVNIIEKVDFDKENTEKI